MGRFTGLKQYHTSIWGRLPSADLRGCVRDILLHLRMQPSKQRHIFVMGPPRSGTTLLRGIIASHSDVAAIDDETFFFIRRRISKFSAREIPNFHQLFNLAACKIDLFDRIAKQVRDQSRSTYFLEKTPEHALVLPDLLNYFPESRFIFIVRDGRDAFSSSFRNPELLKFGSNYPKLWRDSVRKLLASQHAPQIKTVKYEDIVSDPYRSVSEIMSFIGISAQDRQLDPINFSNTSMSLQIGHEMLSHAINPGSVGNYRKNLTRSQIQFFERIASNELVALGYSI